MFNVGNKSFICMKLLKYEMEILLFQTLIFGVNRYPYADKKSKNYKRICSKGNYKSQNLQNLTKLKMFSAYVYALVNISTHSFYIFVSFSIKNVPFPAKVSLFNKIFSGLFLCFP